MKKFISTVLIVALVLSMFTVGAFAADAKASPKEPRPHNPSKTKIVDSVGQVVAEVPDPDVIVTPITENKEAWQQMSNANSIADICPDIKNNIPAGRTAEDYVVTDVCKVSLSSEYQDYLTVPGNTISANFSLGYVPSMVLQSNDGKTWSVVSNDRITVNGTDVTVVFDSQPYVAFVREKSQAGDTAGAVVVDKNTGKPVVGDGTGIAAVEGNSAVKTVDGKVADENGVVTSPQTGDNGVAALFAVLLVALGACFVVYGRRKNN